MVSLAGACLGNPVEAVERLHSAGLLPNSMPQEQKEKLASWLDVSPNKLSNAIIANPYRVAAFLGLPTPTADPPKEIPEGVTPLYPLFPHQRRALSALLDLLELQHDRAVLHMPTGGGKTRTTMNLVCDRLRRSDRAAVLWVASTKELLSQAAQEFASAWRYLGNRDVPIHAAWEGRDWEPTEINDGLLVASLPTLYQFLKKRGIQEMDRLGASLQLIVFDEAHQAIANTYREVIERLSVSGNPITPIVGLTATPGRSYLGNDQDDELAEFFGQKKVMLDTTVEGGPSNPVDYLIEHGYLANTEFELIGHTESETGEQQHSAGYPDDLEDSSDLDMNTSEYIELVVTKTLELVREGHVRILVFAASVGLAKTVASVLRVAGINAQSVDGSTDLAVRDTLIREYTTRSRDPRILVNFGVLTTGFDAPQTSAAVIGRPTRSLSLYSQMVGRAVRGPRAGGNKRAKIATVVDPSVPAFGNIAEAFTHWNTYWE